MTEDALFQLYKEVVLLENLKNLSDMGYVRVPVGAID